MWLQQNPTVTNVSKYLVISVLLPGRRVRPWSLNTNLKVGESLEITEIEFLTNSVGLGTQNRN